MTSIYRQIPEQIAQNTADPVYGYLFSPPGENIEMRGSSASIQRRTNHVFTLSLQMVDLGMSSILIKFPSKAFRNTADPVYGPLSLYLDGRGEGEGDLKVRESSESMHR